ncbi:riboflavin synthase [Leuconostoc lactis]|uniref:riboflavin synthase n=1 Tax=Leuconostoc lactis TaxID=1246 RepID=UPI00020DA03F|nr:riboflavin synthase [Leuconostoc lactis]
MFTGITQIIGRVTSIQQQSSQTLRPLVTAANHFFETSKIGDSIMIDGVCLTIVTKTADVATFDIMQPTYITTIVQQYQIGQAVNLEKAMLATDRFDGHIVSGHVDGMAQVTQVAEIDDTVLLTFKPEQPILQRQIVPKGAITVSGVSLTVVTCATDTFTIGLIPHTLTHTTLSGIRVGDKVNLETDILAKYLMGATHE